MSTQTVQSVGVTALPRVNLLPPEIAQAARFKQLQMVMAGAVVLAVLVVGYLYHQAHSGIASARNDLATAQAAQSGLHAKLAGLSNVSQTQSKVAAQKQLLATAMGGEIDWSYLLNDLSLRVPSNVWLTTVQASEGGTAATATPAPGAATTIGSVAFNCVAFTHNDVAALLDSLAKEKGLTTPTLDASVESVIGTRSVTNCSVTSGVSDGALSNRYAIKAGS